IPLLYIETHNIEDEDEALHHSIDDIVKKLTRKEIFLNPQLEVVGEESSGCVDYAIKCIENFNCHNREKTTSNRHCAYQTNKRKRKADGAFGGRLQLSLWNHHHSHGLAMAKEENEAELHKNVKRVMEVIIGLLKDRADVVNEQKKKKARVQEYLKKE
ncbi:18617_t:CDS:2, partial [Gigaspora margarita]